MTKLPINNDPPKIIIPTSSEIKDLQLNQVIKPKLRKFVLDAQRKKAEQTFTKEKEERKNMLSSDEIIERATQLSKKALIQLKLWQQFAPTLQMNWTVRGVVNPELAKEQHVDVSGFAYYLIREYQNYLRLKKMVKGYRNPLSDEHLQYFWIKCQQDLRLLLEADRRRVAAGNKPVILTQKPN